MTADRFKVGDLIRVKDYLESGEMYVAKITMNLSEDCYQIIDKEPSEETLEIEGKKYRKEDVIDRLKELKEVD